jgi:hypothetical protein
MRRPGELRIKVLQPHCADRIASVSLRLELNEFGEVKHLRHGAAIPEIKKLDNQTLGDDSRTLYDYGPYDKAMSDPALWFVRAEERTVWSTEATLFENSPSLSTSLRLNEILINIYRRLFPTSHQALHRRLASR